MERRVVITGLGAITPIGKDVNESWNSILNKKCGIDNISLFDNSTFKTKVDAEVKNYESQEYFDLKQSKRLDRSSQFAIIASREAFKDSGITKENTDFERVGVFVSSGIAGLSTIQEQCTINCPFDKERSGFVMGEGAGVLVLEELEHAQKRGAKIYAEIIGYGATSDAYHITSPAPDGEGAARAMTRAIEDAKIKPEDINYINAHGTSTHLNDSCETMAIKKALGEYSSKVMISSTKGNTGHLLGAAGGVEAIFCTKAIEQGKVPPTINYKEKDEECDLDIVPNEVRNEKINIVMSNSLGFGGHNASIILKKYE